MTAERPRDRLGRPLPPDAPSDQRGPDVPSIDGLSDPQVWTLAWDSYLQGLPFHAHEICEQRWRTCAEQDRLMWKALAQWGAAEVHHARGNDEGARRLAQRALEGLATGSDADLPLDLARARCRSLR